MQFDTDAITDAGGELVGITTLTGTMTLHAMDDPDPAVLLILDDPAELMILAAAAMAAALHLVRVGQHHGPDGNMPDQARVAQLVHRAAATAHTLSGRMLGLTQ